MPFERTGHSPRRIAIVGAGISGMAAALELSREHAITLFEKAPRIGGHARTVVAGKRGDQPVDTGFIVYNKVNYPNLTALFERLDVPTVESDMSFGASIAGGAIEYSTQTLNTVFAQRRNLLRPRFLRMIRDILRWNAHAADAARDSSIPLGQFLDRLGVGQAFRDWYLGPISGAIWSTPSTNMMDFPADAMVRFFDNHNLLQASGQHQWYTVRGGSREYVGRLESELRRVGVEIRTSAGLRAVRRVPGGVEIRQQGDDWEIFDEVVMACHADETLALLSDPTDAEQAALGAVRFQSNEAVLHADAAQMPRNRLCWSAWNYTEAASGPAATLGLTYWMNRLQPIPLDDLMLVTLNPSAPIREELIYDQTTFMHPVYDLAMARGVDRIKSMNGDRHTWFCGAWMRNGFHEDGYASAVEVAKGMARRSAVDAVA